MIKYKLVDSEGYTRKGMVGETCWLDGLEKIATGKGSKLCSNGVIHYYDHPLLAVLFNPIHAGVTDARLIEININTVIVHDGLKGGCKKAKYIKEIELPTLTIEQRVIFAIKISLKYYKAGDYKKWATGWLSGKDRSVGSAASAALSAESAARGVAAESAVWAAESAERITTIATGNDVAWAAQNAESAVAWAAESAAWAASDEGDVSWAAKINKYFIKIISKIVRDYEKKEVKKG